MLNGETLQKVFKRFITETIKIQDTKSLNKTIGKVDIELINGETKHFSLNSFFFPERRKINDFFEEINNHLPSIHRQKTKGVNGLID